MRYAVNMLLCISALFALLMTGGMIYGILVGDFSDGRGMALLMFQLWGMIAIVATALSGGISFLIGRKMKPPKTGFGKTGLYIAAVCLTIMLVMFAIG